MDIITVDEQEPAPLTRAEKRRQREAEEAERAARQDAAIMALVSGATKTDAAQAAGISRDTLYQWLADSRFQQRLRDERAFVWAEYKDRLRAIATKAASTVDALLDSDDEKVRLGAAAAVLRILAPPHAHYSAHHDFESRFREG
jgi:hypothetical protein